MNTYSFSSHLRFGHHYQLKKPVPASEAKDLLWSVAQLNAPERGNFIVAHQLAGNKPPMLDAFTCSDVLNPNIEALLDSQNLTQDDFERISVVEHVIATYFESNKNPKYYNQYPDSEVRRARNAREYINQFNPDWFPTVEELIPLYQKTFPEGTKLGDSMRIRLTAFLEAFGIEKESAIKAVDSLNKHWKS